jgi:hypothetical protein
MFPKEELSHSIFSGSEYPRKQIEYAENEEPITFCNNNK